MKEFITQSDFKCCPVWRYNEDIEGHSYSQVNGLDDLPDLVGDLSILAEFTTPNGIKILGQIGGIDRIFAIGLFIEEETFFFNKNLPELSKERAEEFLIASGLSSELSYETLFPLRYETKWGGPIFKDFSGVFEMPPDPASTA